MFLVALHSKQIKKCKLFCYLLKSIEQILFLIIMNLKRKVNNCDSFDSGDKNN